MDEIYIGALDFCFAHGLPREDMDRAFAGGDELSENPLVFVIHPAPFSVDAALKFGVSLNVRDEHGNNALWYALCNGQYARARLLLDRGIDFTSRNGEGKLPIEACTPATPADIRRRLCYDLAVAIFTLPIPRDICASIIHTNDFGFGPPGGVGARVRP